MKAARYTRYGPPEVVSIQEMPKPAFRENELLVRVHATTVNRTDSGFRSAEYFVSRFWSGLLRPKLGVLGNEFSGVVEETGSKVQSFKPGDRVFGYTDTRFGAHAEFMVMGEEEGIAHIPDAWSFEEAAPLTEGSHYALCDIRAARVQAGQQSMVYGATGAIGSAAVQLLKHFGAKVTAVCHTRHVEVVKSLGADLVVDYATEDFTKTGLSYDFIFDAVGKSSYAACKPLLKEKGIYVSTELGKNGINIPLALIGRFSKGKKLIFPIPTINKEDVLFIKELAEKGSFKPLIDRSYALEEIVEAYSYVETGQKLGNVIIKV